MTTNSKSDAIRIAKNAAVQSRRSNVFFYVCVDRDGYEVLDSFQYEAFGSEDKCVAAVWSYMDGAYDSKNVFHENGLIAAGVEEY